MKNATKLKNLFNTFRIIAIVAVIGFSIIACGGDDDGGSSGGNAGGNTGGNTGSGSSGLVGKWYLTQESADDAAEYGFVAAYEFKSNGELILAGVVIEDPRYKTYYTATANTITMNLSGVTTIYEPAGYTISGTVLTITSELGKDGHSKSGFLPGTYYKPRR